MSWAIGYDAHWERDVGYGVPAICDHPDCSNKIDRGLAYVCGAEPYGGECNCGLFFCPEHQSYPHQRCERCADEKEPFKPKPDLLEWMIHKLNDESWSDWRRAHPDDVEALEKAVKELQEKP